MIYHSTRDEKLTAAPTRAVLEGIAPDGGLYVCDPGSWILTGRGPCRRIPCPWRRTFWVHSRRTFRI
ncbi:MAG: hypothetical protein ACLUIX_09715 [Oscillospiraceae bacterium]